MHSVAVSRVKLCSAAIGGCSPVKRLLLIIALAFASAVPVNADTNIRDIQIFKNVSATQGPFTLHGGAYAVKVLATFGGGSVTLQVLADDGSTYVTCLTAFSANGYATVNLPSGTYQFLVTTATAVYVSIISIVVPLA